MVVAVGIAVNVIFGKGPTEKVAIDDVATGAFEDADTEYTVAIVEGNSFATVDGNSGKVFQNKEDIASADVASTEVA